MYKYRGADLTEILGAEYGPFPIPLLPFIPFPRSRPLNPATGLREHSKVKVPAEIEFSTF